MPETASLPIPWVPPSRQDGLRHLGYGLMILGTSALVVALPCSIALMNIGFAVALAGALLARAPLHRVPGFWAGCAFSAWIVAAALLSAWNGVIVPADSEATGLHTAVSHRVRIEGQAYTWLALPLTVFIWQHAVLRRRLLTVLALVLAAAALLTVLQASLGHGGPGPLRIDLGAERKGSGFFNEHLTHGFIAALCAIAFWSVGREAPPRARWLGRTASVIACLASLSRSPLLGGLLGGAAALGQRGGRYIAIAGMSVVVAAALALVGLKLVKPAKFDALMRGEDGRMVLWRSAAAVIAESPVLGAGGQNGYRAAERRLHPQANPGIPPEFVYRPAASGATNALTGLPKGAPHAHSSFLSLACERGIPAAALYAVLLASVGIALWRRSGAPRTLATGLIVCALVAGLFERFAGDVESGFALFALLGLAAALPGRIPGSDLQERRP